MNVAFVRSFSSSPLIDRIRTTAHTAYLTTCVGSSQYAHLYILSVANERTVINLKLIKLPGNSVEVVVGVRFFSRIKAVTASLFILLLGSLCME